MLKSLCIIGVLLIGLFGTTYAIEAVNGPAAQSDEIISEGNGEGANEAEALLAAKRDAIEKGIGQILLSQTEVENFMVKRDQIITKTMGSVKSFLVLSKTNENALVQMHIKAVLLRNAMRQDLAAFQILIESMDKPRTMVIIDENNVGNGAPSNNAAETAICKFLRTPYEFDVVDPQSVAAIKASQAQVVAAGGDPAAVAAVAAKHGAEVVITGSAVSRAANASVNQNLGGMVSVQATVTLRAINCATGRIIGTADGQAAKVHINAETAGNQAIAKASEKAAGILLDAIIKEWQNQQNNGALLTLTVSNVASFHDKTTILGTLNGFSNVTAVRERSWDDQSKVLEVDIQYKGNAQGFCSRIDGYKFKSGGGSFGVSGQSGTRVALKAQAQ
jgi:hypothetical protein